MKKILILGLAALTLLGCVNPHKSDYYINIKEDEYEDYRFQDETPLPEYKLPPNESHYLDN
jgi:hypothetical protein